MKTNWKVSLVAIIATVVSMGATAAEKSFNIGGDAEYDITHRKQTNSAKVTTKNFSEAGRVKLNAKARIDNDNGTFVEAVAQPLFNYNDGKNAATDDLYIKFGRKAWDIQLGRFEAIDLAPAGKDTVANRADGDNFGYGASKARGRDGSDASSTNTDLKTNGTPVHGAAHFNIGKTQVELGAMYRDADGRKLTGVRPVVKFDAGRFRIAAGYDSYSDKTKTGTYNTKFEGYGITAGTKVGSFDANFNVAQGKDKKDTASSAKKMTTYGMNATRGRFGAGYVHDKTNTVGKQDTFYTAYSVPLMGSKDATVTFAASTSKAKYDAGFGGGTAKDTSARIRFNYSF